jgi:hypothetical protein
MNQQKSIDWGSFITLSTHIKKKECEDEISPSTTIDHFHTNHTIHTIHTKNLVMAEKYDSQELSAIIEWISIMVEEGHIEPSQPCVGRIIG